MANTKVTTNVIADDAVTTAKIADNAITAAKIAAGAVVADIANDSIDSQHYVAASIDNEHLADDAVDSAELAAGSVDLAHMSVNSIDSDQYVDGSIDLVHMSANSVDSDQYVDGSIDLAHMSVNSIDSDQYVDGSIDTAHIAASQITNALMADDAIDSAEIASGAIDLAHMSVNSIDSDQYVDGSIDLVHMSVNSIDSDQYVDGSIDNAHIADDAIDSEHYAAGSIDTAHIAASQITNALMADDAIGIAELSATGTASSTSYLRGDNVWDAISGGTITALNNATANELVTVGSTTTELDAETLLTFDGTKLGIGVAAPDYKATIHGSTTTMNNGAGACLQIHSTDDTTSMVMLGCDADPNTAGIGYTRPGERLWLSAGGGSENAATSAFVLTGAGNVGIGTNAPMTLLHVFEGDGSYPDDANNHLVIESDSHSYLGIGGGSSSDVGIHFGDSGAIDRGRIAYLNASDAMTFNTAQAEVMRITSAGNVGIGRTPEAYGSNRYVNIQAGSSGAAVLNIQGNTTSGGKLTLIGGTSTGQVGTESNHPLIFSTNQVEEMRLLAGGGLTFNGDTAAANALDDYEEGTWDPTLKGTTGSAGSWAESSWNGKYTKVGGVVFFHASGYLTNKGSYTGDTVLDGLPYANTGSTTAFSMGMFPDVNVNDNTIRVQSNGSTTIGFYEGEKTDAAHPYSDIVTGYYCNVSGHYLTW